MIRLYACRLQVSPPNIGWISIDEYICNPGGPCDQPVSISLDCYLPTGCLLRELRQRAVLPKRDVCARLQVKQILVGHRSWTCQEPVASGPGTSGGDTPACGRPIGGSSNSQLELQIFVGLLGAAGIVVDVEEVLVLTSRSWFNEADRV